MPVSVPIIYWQWGKSKKKSNLTCIDMISQKIQKWNWAVWPRKQQNTFSTFSKHDLEITKMRIAM